jgi:hypothetical protein
VRQRIARSARVDDSGPVPAPVRAEERLALRVEPGQRLGTGEVDEVVPALPVLGLVIDHAVRHLDLADRVVALEVRGVVPRVPQAELHGAEQGERRGRRPPVGEAGPPDLERLAGRHEVERLGLDPRAATADHGVAESVAAAVVLQVGPDRLPRR